MKTPVRRLALLVVLLPAAFAAGSVAAIEPETLPQPLTGVAQTVAEAAESAGRETGRAGGAAEGYPGVIESAGAEAGPPRSRLLQSLRDGAEATASQGPLAVVAEDPAAGVAGDPDDRVVFGCPRALLSALLAGAAETGGAVSALAIEREILGLCRERQEIVTGIVTLEGELRALLAGSRGETAGTTATATGATVAEPPIVKESTPVPFPGPRGTGEGRCAEAPVLVVVLDHRYRGRSASRHQRRCTRLVRARGRPPARRRHGRAHRRPPAGRARRRRR